MAGHRLPGIWRPIYSEGISMRVPAWFKAMVLAAVAATLCACSTSGNNFNAATLTELVPGKTTLADTAALLQANPETTYRSTDGSVTALWTYQRMGLDYLLYRKSALVQFSPDGSFQRVVHTSGIISDATERTRQLELAAFLCGSGQGACP